MSAVSGRSGLQAIASQRFVLVLQLSVTMRELLGSPVLAFGHLGREEFHLCLEPLHLGKPRQQVSQHSSVASRGDLLGEVPDGGRLRPPDLTRVHLHSARQDAAQGGLAGSIRADQADPLVPRDMPREVMEQHLPAEGLANVFDLNHENTNRWRSCNSWTSRHPLSQPRNKTILRECIQDKQPRQIDMERDQGCEEPPPRQFSLLAGGMVRC